MVAIPDYPLDDVLVLRTPEQVRAVSDPARGRILAALSVRAAMLTQLAAELQLQGCIGHHIRVLAEAGLVQVVRAQHVRGSVHRYWGRTAREFQFVPGDLSQ